MYSKRPKWVWVILEIWFCLKEEYCNVYGFYATIAWILGLIEAYTCQRPFEISRLVYLFFILNYSMFIKENLENTEKSKEKKQSLIKKNSWLFCGLSFHPL